MSQTEHALQLLARVSASDRDWIVRHLSTAAKTRLADRPAIPAPSHAEPAVVDIDNLLSAHPDRIYDALWAEPPWLICAVLRAHKFWPWRKQVLQALAPATRADVIQLERHGVRLSQPATDVLLRSLAERVGPPADEPPASRFESLLARVRKVGRA